MQPRKRACASAAADAKSIDFYAMPNCRLLQVDAAFLKRKWQELHLSIKINICTRRGKSP
jgi:hypothetical protein